MREHKCAASGCPDLVPVAHLMCLQHWVLVPRPLQEMINREYRHPSSANTYNALVKKAIRSVRDKESPPSTETIS